MPNPAVMMPILSLDSLVIRRGRSFSVRIDSLEAGPGRTVCLVGANGCGKTTLLEALAGIITPASGKIRIEGKPLDGRDPRLKRLVGYLPDDDAWIIPELTAAEYFKLLASLLPVRDRRPAMDRASSLADRLSFSAFHSLTVTLSHGNRKKVQLIAALMHRPKLLAVDELRNGLDPLSLRVAEELLLEEVRLGAALMASSHDLVWSERMADTVIVLAGGRITAEADPAQLRRENLSLEEFFLRSLERKADA